MLQGVTFKPVGVQLYALFNIKFQSRQEAMSAMTYTKTLLQV